jgi:hypothetical protein
MSRSALAAVYNVTLRLGDIRELFGKPEIDPFSERFADHSHTSGIEFIADELYSSPSLKSVHATVILPPDTLEPDLEQRTRAAIRRYCRSRLVEKGQAIRAAQGRIGRSFLVAIVALFVLNGMATVLLRSGVFFGEVIGEGLVIAGWVLLWFPLDELLVTLHYDRLHRAIYGRLMEMGLTIRAAVDDRAAGGGA